MNKKLTNEIFKPMNKNFERRHVFVASPDLIWGADLVDMSRIKNKNKRITFLLNVIDIYSRYAWSIPLKSKSKEDVLTGFKSIVDETGRHPDHLWVDEGREFYNQLFQDYCKSKDITLYSTHTGLKSVFVERFNRTMKESFYKYLAENKTSNYYDFLPIFMKTYNNSKRRPTKETPYNLYFEDGESREKIPEIKKRPSPKFQVGDYVRLSKVKGTFEKGYTARYTHEVFKITEVDISDYPYLYQLEDLQGEPIDGKAYEKELIKTIIPHFKLVDKIVKRKTENGKKKVLVSFVGHNAKFNEWMTEEEYKRRKKEE